MFGCEELWRRRGGQFKDFSDAPGESGYGDAEVSGQADAHSQPTGVLQSVSGYEGIYETWDADIDGDGTAEEP